MDIFREELFPLLKRPSVIIGMVLALIVAIVIGVDRAGSVHMGTDFYMYYTSGVHFAEGEYLYKNIQSGAPYVYPPFAAFLFQWMQIVGQPAAVGIVFVLNFFLTIVNGGLIYAIARKMGYAKRRATIAMALALIFSFTDVWANINFSQINTFIFFLTLYGIYSYLNGKAVRALILLSIGAWIKVLPVFFVFWILIRGFTWKRFLVVCGVSLICVGGPILQRGFDQGTGDLIGYYHDFLSENMVDGVNTIWRNQSLSAAISRAFSPTENLEGLNYMWFDLGEQLTGILVKVIPLMVFFFAFGISIWRRIKGISITVYEIGLVYLAIHLFSGVTWRGHLLTTFFMLMPLFLIRIKELKWPVKLFHLLLILWFGVLLAGVKSVWPGNGFLYLHGYSLISWGLLMLYGYYAVMVLKENRDGTQFGHAV